MFSYSHSNIKAGKVGHFLWAHVSGIISQKVLRHVPPKVTGFSQRPYQELRWLSVSTTVTPDRCKECYQTGLYPIYRSDAGLAATH